MKIKITTAPAGAAEVESVKASACYYNNSCWELLQACRTCSQQKSPPKPSPSFLAGADSCRDCRFMALSSFRILTTTIGEWISPHSGHSGKRT